MKPMLLIFETNGEKVLVWVYGGDDPRIVAGAFGNIARFWVKMMNDENARTAATLAAKAARKMPENYSLL